MPVRESEACGDKLRPGPLLCPSSPAGFVYSRETQGSSRSQVFALSQVITVTGGGAGCHDTLALM